MSRFLLSCGGTGGHLSPGISLAEGLIARGHEVTLLISQKKVDARQVEKYPHLRFLKMPGAGFTWSPVGAARFALRQFQALSFCVVFKNCGHVRTDPALATRLALPAPPVHREGVLQPICSWRECITSPIRITRENRITHQDAHDGLAQSGCIRRMPSSTTVSPSGLPQWSQRS